MLSEALLGILRCPENRTVLNRADPGLVAAINERIQARQARTRAGRPIERPMDEGLVREQGDVLYPVVDGIPRLLVDEGIPLSQFDLIIPTTNQEGS